MMIEDEAKQKWCPMVRLVDMNFVNDLIDDGEPAEKIVAASIAHNRCSIDPDGDRSGTDYDELKCIGSACMMWRWEKYFLDDGKKVAAMTSDSKGYCGLAGKP